MVWALMSSSLPTAGWSASVVLDKASRLPANLSSKVDLTDRRHRYHVIRPSPGRPQSSAACGSCAGRSARFLERISQIKYKDLEIEIRKGLGSTREVLAATAGPGEVKVAGCCRSRKRRRMSPR